MTGTQYTSLIDKTYEISFSLKNEDPIYILKVTENRKIMINSSYIYLQSNLLAMISLERPCNNYQNTVELQKN